MNLISAFQYINTQLNTLSKHKPIRVAVNGIERAGKTVFAKNFTAYLNNIGKTAIHISIDGFHFEKTFRYRKGRAVARGYYEDAYNECVFVEKVLLSSQKPNPKVTTAIHDLDTDKNLNYTPKEINNETIIITDGAYLFKPIYRNHWDFKIYLKTDFKTALKRVVVRDASLLGGVKSTKELYKSRYHKASEI